MAETNPNGDIERLPPDNLVVLRRLGWLCILALIFPFSAILFLAWVKTGEKSDDLVASITNLSWVLVIFGGFAFLLVSLFSAAVLFRVFNLHDKSHSLGLPRNSVRSLLTFLIFLILMAFIFYSTHIVSNQSSEGIAKIPIGKFNMQTLATLGIADRVTGYRVISEGGVDVAEVTFLIDEESVALEYFDRILIALLGISSTIIGFYFGTRAREDPGEGKARPDAQNEPAPAGAAGDGAEQQPDDSDSLVWSIATNTLVLRPDGDAGLFGTLTVNPSDPEGSRAFEARFVPTEDHDTEFDNAEVTVARLADRLTLRVRGVTPEQLRAAERQMSVYYRDEEERAQTVPVEYRASD